MPWFSHSSLACNLSVSERCRWPTSRGWRWAPSCRRKGSNAWSNCAWSGWSWRNWRSSCKDNVRRWWQVCYTQQPFHINKIFVSLKGLGIFFRLVVGCWVGWEEMNSRWKWKWDLFGVRGRCLKMGLWWFFLNMEGPEGCHDQCNYELTMVD